MSVVIDATVAVKWYFPEVYCDECLALLDQAEELVVPDLLFTQVGTAVWKRVKSNELKPVVAEGIMSNLSRLPLRRVSNDQLIGDAMKIATLSTRTFQEAIYFALAMRCETPLVTADRRWYSLLNTGPMKNHLAFVGDVITQSQSS